MSQPIITIENLSKSYSLLHSKTNNRYISLRDVIAQKTKSFSSSFKGKKNDPASKSNTTEEFWALNNISFSINPGEVVGIIGRNGAGKSTLLKILSRITEPTKGKVILRGRVASLLEVGTGFHPELTGRENIYLNGAILGMKRTEINSKFDEIVEFAGVEKFLDTPVKRYSSGMYVRLAFAVAAHMEPEILVVDEVLAVGDAEFQKKCMGKMQDVAGHGRTVLFVSHQESAIKRLCNRAVLLKNGEISYDGTPDEAFKKYNTFAEDQGFTALRRTHSSDLCKIIDASIHPDLDGDGREFTSAQLNITVKADMNFKASFEFSLSDAESRPILFLPLGAANNFIHSFVPGVHQFNFRLKLPYLAAGKYSVDLSIVETGVQYYEHLEGALVLDVNSRPTGESGWAFTQSSRHGSILFDSQYPEITIKS